MLMQIDGQIKCGQRLIEPSELMVNTFPTNHWPWHAAIYHRGNKSVPVINQFGGTVIKSNLILTAAHCVCEHNEPLDASEILVSLGRSNLGADDSSSQNFEVNFDFFFGIATPVSNNFIIRQVDKIFIHPTFSSIDLSNDIAIIRLSTNATFNNYVQPICLWDSNKMELSKIITEV